MEIIVQGKGTEFFTPNEVILNIGFNTKGQSYEEVLSEGVKNVKKFCVQSCTKNRSVHVFRICAFENHMIL